MAERPRNLDDSALLELVQRQTFRYFWDYGHPVSGLSRDRTNYGPDVVTSGGTGFGVMTIIVAIKRGWISRKDGLERLMTMVKFIAKAGSYHGVFPHFWDGGSGQTIPFSRKDDGGDLVETSFLIAGLLCVRQFFDGKDPQEVELRSLEREVSDERRALFGVIDRVGYTGWIGCEYIPSAGTVEGLKWAKAYLK
jgi:hypothetical protein